MGFATRGAGENDMECISDMVRECSILPGCGYVMRIAKLFR